jgi:hypothetical protein
MKKVLILVISFASAGVFGQAVPYNTEFKLNISTPTTNYCPNIVPLNENRFVVFWECARQDLIGLNIFGQLFDGHGNREGVEFQVDTVLNGCTINPVGAALSSGDFVVCWQNVDAIAGPRISGQIFDGSGAKKGGEFTVSSIEYALTLNHNFYQSIVTQDSGEFYVFWHEVKPDRSIRGVYGQRFDASGVKIGEEIRVDSDAQGNQSDPFSAKLLGGEYVICWSREEKNSGWEIFGQLFTKTGERKGGIFHVNTTTRFDQWWPRASMLNDGGFVVCWESGDSESNSVDVFGQLFESSGEKRGAEFQINTYTKDWQGRQTITALGENAFLVIWQSMGQDSSDWGIYGQCFKNSGKKLGAEFRLNDYTDQRQYLPNAAKLNANLIMACWSGFGQYGDDFSIVGKYFPIEPSVHILREYTLLEPGNDATLKNTSVSLRWNQATTTPKCFPFEITYDLYVDLDNDFPKPPVHANLTDTTCSVDRLEAGKTYFWKVLARNIAGDSLLSSNTNGFFVAYDAKSGVTDGQVVSPTPFTLNQNYPNPFNPETSIRFNLPQPGLVQISVVDVSGRLVRTLLSELRNAGSYSVKWDGRDSAGNPVPSGIYICRMEARSSDGRRFTQSVKMGLVR